MTGKQDTIGELFERAIQLEQAAETLYTQMAQLFAHHPDVASFWTRYAGEEQGHAAQLEQVRAGVSAERLSAPADGQILEQARTGLAFAASERLKRVRTLEDAYQLAVELEGSETNAIFEFLITNFTSDELQTLRAFLREQLQRHVRRLETDFPIEYQSRLTRTAVSVQEG